LRGWFFSCDSSNIKIVLIFVAIYWLKIMAVAGVWCSYVLWDVRGVWRKTILHVIVKSSMMKRCGRIMQLFSVSPPLYGEMQKGDSTNFFMVERLSIWLTWEIGKVQIWKANQQSWSYIHGVVSKRAFYCCTDSRSLHYLIAFPYVVPVLRCHRGVCRRSWWFKIFVFLFRNVLK